MQNQPKVADGSIKSRLGYWDGVKAIAIFAVILIHVVPANDLWKLNEADQWMIIIIRQVVNFAVPVFLALSGMNAAMSNRPKDVRYVRLRFSRLWPAYLFWSAIFIVLFRQQDLRHPGAIAVDIFAGRGIGIGYFVIVLSQMILLTPFIARIRSAAGHVAMIIALTFLGKIYTYATVLGLPALGSFPVLGTFPYSALPFFVWYPFYHLGYLMPNRIDLSRPRYAVLALAATTAIVALLVSIAECQFWLPINSGLASAQFKASSAVYSIAVFFVILLCLPIVGQRTPRLFAFAGRDSYFIYLAHIIPLKVITRLATMAGLSQGTVPQVAIVSTATLAACLLTAALARKWLPTRWQPYVLG